jgi:hypothetical protein
LTSGGQPFNALFTAPVGITHDDQFELFRVGSVATDTFKEWAASGETTALRNTLQTNANFFRNVGTVFVASEDVVADAGVDVKFTASPRHHFYSMVSRLEPSPDWFVGADSGEFFFFFFFAVNELTHTLSHMARTHTHTHTPFLTF